MISQRETESLAINVDSILITEVLFWQILYYLINRMYIHLEHTQSCHNAQTRLQNTHQYGIGAYPVSGSESFVAIRLEFSAI